MPRRVYLLGVGLALVAGAFLLTDALLRRPGVTEVNVRRIRVGMTLAEVEALLGGCGEAIAVNREDGDTRECVGVWLWVGPTGAVWVLMDPTGRVVETDWWPSGESPPGPFARLRAWLGW
jgi:hypothetical protein